MVITSTLLLTAIVSVNTWLQPQPPLTYGRLVLYGNQRLVDANAEWHGYELSHYPNNCGFSALSPANLGQIAYFSVDGKTWVGPCLAVDVSKRSDYYNLVVEKREVAEVSANIANLLGFEQGGKMGYVYYGLCPPKYTSEMPEKWELDIIWDTIPPSRNPNLQYPDQQLPVGCKRYGKLE